MRFPVSEVVNGACCAALVVFAVGHAPPMSRGSAVTAAIPMQDAGVARTQSTNVSAERASTEERVLLESPRAGVHGRPAATTETASIVIDDSASKPDALSLSGDAAALQPAADVPSRKSPGGLGAAADGGIDAYVRPIVRQRPKIVPLASRADTKRQKEKTKPAAAKAKAGSKQALGAVTPASVKR